MHYGKDNPYPEPEKAQAYATLLQSQNSFAVNNSKLILDQLKNSLISMTEALPHSATRLNKRQLGGVIWNNRHSLRNSQLRENLSIGKIRLQEPEAIQVNHPHQRNSRGTPQTSGPNTHLQRKTDIGSSEIQPSNDKQCIKCTDIPNLGHSPKSHISSATSSIQQAINIPVGRENNQQDVQLHGESSKESRPGIDDQEASGSISNRAFLFLSPKQQHAESIPTCANGQTSKSSPIFQNNSLSNIKSNQNQLFNDPQTRANNDCHWGEASIPVSKSN